MRQALANAEDGETVSDEAWRAAVGYWFHGDLKRRVAYLKCLTAGAPRYDIHGNVLGAVSEEEAARAAVKLAERQAKLAERRAAVKAKKGPEAAAAAKSERKNSCCPDAVGGDVSQEKESDILRRLKPAASNVEVQRLQLPRRAS